MPPQVFGGAAAPRSSKSTITKGTSGTTVIDRWRPSASPRTAAPRTVSRDAAHRAHPSAMARSSCVRLPSKT